MKLYAWMCQRTWCVVKCCSGFEYDCGMQYVGAVVCGGLKNAQKCRDMVIRKSISLAVVVP